jgi:hypothetical protein
MAKKLAFVHTAPGNVETFKQLLAEIDPAIPAKHYLDESLLQEARATGITPELEQRIQKQMLEAMEEDAAVVLCTCSTIGGSAEQTISESGQGVIRVDRPMAEAAVAVGDRIVVAAALESTIGPTRDLILDVAAQQGREVTILPLLCEGAWERYAAGDQAGYWASIAETLHQAVAGGELIGGDVAGADVIVLAQASMAGAAPLCADLPIPVLSSPRIGLEAAIRAYRAANAT